MPRYFKVPSSGEQSPQGLEQLGKALEEASLQAQCHLLAEFYLSSAWPSQPRPLPCRLNQSLPPEDFHSSWNMGLVLTFEKLFIYLLNKY